jgi:DNA-directed RNA polymerase subunit RPC12/RpoP
MSKEYEPKYSTPFIINELIGQFGSDSKLIDVFNYIIGDRKFRCPKCKGRGFIKVKYNCYPSGLPDSGFVYESAYKDIECDLCKAFGYTNKQMKPKMVQDGWEEVND